MSTTNLRIGGDWDTLANRLKDAERELAKLSDDYEDGLFNASSNEYHVMGEDLDVLWSALDEALGRVRRYLGP